MPVGNGDPTKPDTRSPLVETSIETLSTVGRPMPIDQLARTVMHVGADAAHVAARALTPLLEQDVRLTRVEAGHWALASWTHGTVFVDEAEFVVFDVETNGGRGGRHRVIEIGALRLIGGKVIDHYSSLVRLPRRVSRFVTRYTGITNEMLTDAPPIETVLEDFRVFQASSTLVAHNLPADLAYLNNEALWADRPLFPGDGIDTMELSATLMPKREGNSLAAALAAAGIQDAPSHRALEDARVTAELFLFLLQRLPDKKASVATLRTTAANGGPEGRLPRRSRELARWASRSLPPAPGVYMFRDSDAQTLYVGKTVSLQKRVRSHFTDSTGFIRRRDGMLDRITSIDWEPTGSELRALVREAELIETLAPEYNIQRQRRPGRRFICLGPANAALINTASEVREGTETYVGPFPTTRDALLAANTARRIFGLPTRKSPDQSVAGWRRDGAIAFLGKGRKAAQAVISQAPSHADQRRDILRRIRRVRIVRTPIRGGPGANPALVVTSGAVPGAVELARIDDGLITAIASLTHPKKRELRETLRNLQEAPMRSSSTTTNEQHIVLSWLHAHMDTPEILAWDNTLSKDFVDLAWQRLLTIAATES
ncbi:MAG: hypothetical protein CL790_01285 [Chloroflexi bacterium]|nr:hypothetical protein [Chloroflexota bacterium]